LGSDIVVHPLTFPFPYSELTAYPIHIAPSVPRTIVCPAPQCASSVRWIEDHTVVAAGRRRRGRSCMQHGVCMHWFPEDAMWRPGGKAWVGTGG